MKKRDRPAKKAKRASRSMLKSRVEPSSLLYKVVELSNVDESALETCLNEYAPLGWKLDGVQFAMRESSKRPAMAFVFFTKAGPAPSHSVPKPRGEALAYSHLQALAQVASSEPARDPWQRLSEMGDVAKEDA